MCPAGIDGRIGVLACLATDRVGHYMLSIAASVEASVEDSSDSGLVEIEWAIEENPFNASENLTKASLTSADMSRHWMRNG